MNPKIIMVVSIALISLILSCKNDTGLYNSAVKKEALDTILSNIIYSTDSTTFSNAIHEDKSKPEVIINEVTGNAIDVKKVSINKDSISELIGDRIKASFNKGKTCEDMFTEYEALIKAYISSEDDKVGIQIAEWIKDPLHLNCYKSNQEYKTKVDKLDDL